MMGTGPFAVPTFQALLDSEHQVPCLVTRPDKPARGRKKLPLNPMREVAQANGLPVFAPVSINSTEGLALLDDQQPELLVVCDYGQILSADSLSKAPLGGINLHGSLLPKYRGAAPINWALLNGDTRAGVTVIHMTPRLDGGPMLCQRTLEVGDDEDALQLERRLSRIGVDAVLEAIGMLDEWDGTSSIGEAQSRHLVSKAPRLKKSDGRVDWHQSAVRISHQVRALKPWPSTFSHLLRGGKRAMRLILDKVSVVNDQLELPVGSGRANEEGKVVVQCGEGVLCLERLQPAGKRVMESAEFVRGYGATVLRFGDPEAGADKM